MASEEDQVANAVVETETAGSGLVFEIPSCPVESVVVYLDRAEVCRTVSVQVKAGENEVILRNVSSSVDKDSVRVEGHGAAVITEVSFQTKHVTAKPAAAPVEGSSQQESAQLLEEIKVLEKQIATLESEKNRLNCQRGMLDSFAEQLMYSASKEGGLASVTNQSSLEGLDQFLTMYDREAEQLDNKLIGVEKEQAQLNEKLASLQKTVGQRDDNLPSTATHEESEVSILLDAQDAGTVSLIIYYVVSNASWAPKYDVRTYVNDARMQIHYFGVIRQSTGEDWKDARISLSTAVPSVGGTPPEITAKQLSLSHGRYQNYGMESSKSRNRLGSIRKKGKRVSGRMLSSAPGARASDDEDEMAMGGAEVQAGFTTAFEIEKPATIPADNTGHKVLVSVIGLKPAFSYESVPKLSARAFLKAKVKNDSPFALLAGPTNIFLEDNFVAKSSLVSVSPQEEFECSLGVDPSVRVTYKPVQRFREQSGFVSKTTTFKFRQLIEIKNTQPEAITIKVSDQLPLSTEEKIKVQLVEPEVKKPERGKPLAADAYPRLNNSNNIEWQLSIPPSEKKELILRYTVEFPTDQKIDGL